MQDVFPIIPGDTDYRIFSEDYGDIPGLDIIFLLGGYFYHTSYDTLEQFLYVLYLLYLVRIFYFNFISLFSSLASKVMLLMQWLQSFSRQNFYSTMLPFFIVFFLIHVFDHFDVLFLCLQTRKHPSTRRKFVPHNQGFY